MKIVIPVDKDKNTIYKRTGQAPFFNIYEDADLIESVSNNHDHGDGHGHGHGNKHGHDHEHSDSVEHLNEHKKDIESLKGCDIILVQALGEHMGEALESINLKVMKLRKNDGTNADEVIAKFLNNDLVNQKK